MCEDKFLEIIKEEICKRVGEEICVNTRKVRKNNNVVYLAVLLQQKDQNIAPTIYLNDFYEAYQQGESPEAITDKILEIYEQGKVDEPVDMDFFLDFEKVKDRIAYRLINADKNKELLEKVPHIIYMDLAICFYYAFHDNVLGEGMILIYNSHMDMWKTSHEELMQLAERNTPELFPELLVTMEEILGDIFEGQMSSKLYVLSNQQKCHGAAALLYPGILQEAAAKLGGDYYVLPSSVHEVLLLKKQEYEDSGVLQDMIEDANANHVLEEEVLSDNLYYYDVVEEKLIQVKRSGK